MNIIKKSKKVQKLEKLESLLMQNFDFDRKEIGFEDYIVWKTGEKNNKEIKEDLEKLERNITKISENYMPVDLNLIDSLCCITNRQIHRMFCCMELINNGEYESACHELYDFILDNEEARHRKLGNAEIIIVIKLINEMKSKIIDKDIK